MRPTLSELGEYDGCALMEFKTKKNIIYLLHEENVCTYEMDDTQGVPNETRQPFPDGSTDFERILPGPDRMYPDTDSLPTRVTRERVRRLRSTLPQAPWIREERYRAAGNGGVHSHTLEVRVASSPELKRDGRQDARCATMYAGMPGNGW
jgi:Glu-tRNA(Gln) amidotransferase subunit E-like FAD-binding protein